MPGVAFVVALMVSILGTHRQGTEDFSVPPKTTALYVWVHRNAAAKGKQLHARQRTKASTVALTNR
jgi:hypothetical protein